MKTPLLKITFLLLLLACGTINAQVTITTGPNWKDVLLMKSLLTSEAYMATTNYNTYPRLAANAWTHSSNQITYRTLMRFELSTIPVGSVVQSAVLYMNSDPANTSGEISNQSLSGSNAIYLQKVTQSWNPTTVTWNTQPTTTTTNRVWVGPSTSATENIQVDITALVQDMVNNPSSNYGIMMSLENEVYYRSRNYASTDHSNTALHPKLLITLSDPITEYFAESDRVFQNINRTPVSTGLLKDYGFLYADIDKFNGVLQSDNYTSRSIMQALQTSLYAMKFNGNANVTAPDVMNQAMNTYTASDVGVNNIAMMHYNYEKFVDDAVTSNLIYLVKDQVYDTPNRPRTPYEVKPVFVAAPMTDYFYGASQTFKLRSELFYKNVTKPISSIQIDFGDGTGYKAITLGTATTVNYTSNGQKTLQYRLTYTDGQVLESHSQITIDGVPTTCSNCRYSTPFMNEQVFPQGTFPVPVAQMGGARVTAATGLDNIFDKPIIIIEGFDPFDRYRYSALTSSNALGVIIDQVTGQSLRTSLENSNYDVVFVDFTNTLDDIKRNAYVVENVISWVNAHKTGTQQNIVVGISMGGLIGRYALRDMEVRNVNHQTKLFATVDSPHQGANVPLAFQAAVRALCGIGLGPFNLKNASADLSHGFDVLNSTSAKQMLYYQLSGDGDAIAIDNTPHTNFMSEYVAMGYPRSWGIRNIAISNGSECGTSQTVVPNAQLMSVDGSKSVNYFINLLLTSARNPFGFFSGLIQTNSDLKVDFDARALSPNQRFFYLRVYIKKTYLWGLGTSETTYFKKSLNTTSSMLAIDSAPGGLTDINDFTAVPNNVDDFNIHFKEQRFCFVPTFSSLDIGAGTQTITSSDLTKVYSNASPPPAPKNVPFNNFFTNPLTNERHATLTTPNGQWLFQEIKGTPVNINCYSVCTGISSPPVLSGPNTVCYTSNAIYTISGMPAGATPTWGNSSNITYVSGQYTTSYTVKGYNSGNGTISANITGPCGNYAQPKPLSVRVGGYSSSDYPVSGPSSACRSTYASYSTPTLVGATNYQWFYPSDWSYSSGQGTPNLTVYTGMYNGTVGVRVANACDAGGSPGTYFTYISSCGFIVAIYPNPADNQLTVQSNTGEENVVESEVEEPLLKKPSNKIFKIKLYDSSNQLKRTGNTQDGLVTLDIKDLPKGVYILKIETTKETITEKVMIER